ncbi:MAG: hypothetical protein H3C60_10015 [Sphingomonadaceae bacterium]|nr:hypothetical protein [Sphingomonadaceae bacterium]
MERGKPRMCIVNPALVEDIAPLAGSQSKIMRRAGISWNSWIKVSAGLPIRVSVGRRLKERILQRAHESDGLRRKFPAFLRPAAPAIAADLIHLPPIRSIRRARQLRARRYPAARGDAAAFS